jgi:hypothetical protein
MKMIGAFLSVQCSPFAPDEAKGFGYAPKCYAAFRFPKDRYPDLSGWFDICPVVSPALMFTCVLPKVAMLGSANEVSFFSHWNEFKQKPILIIQPGSSSGNSQFQ